MAKVERTDGVLIELTTMSFSGVSGISHYQTDFIQAGQAIARASRVLGFQFTKLYELETADNQDDELILASLIILEIMYRENSNSNNRNRNRGFNSSPNRDQRGFSGGRNSGFSIGKRR